MANRDAIITKTMTEMHNIELDIKAAIEKHVQPLRDAKKKLRQDAKKDLDMPMSAFDPIYRLFKAEKDAAQFMDEDEADERLDQMREVWKAMAGQLDWLTAAETAEGGFPAEEPPLTDAAA